MINQIKDKLKVNKWWFHIPVIGPIIYAIRFEFFINKLVLDPEHPEYKIYRGIKFWKSISNIVSLLIAISFLVPFFVLRDTGDYGSWPWFFWLGLAIGLVQNITPYYGYLLYNKGLKRALNKKEKPSETKEKTIEIKENQ